MATSERTIVFGTQVYDTNGVRLGVIERDARAGEATIRVIGGISPRVLPIASIRSVRSKAIVLSITEREFLDDHQHTAVATRGVKVTGTIVDPDDLMAADDHEFKAMGRSHVKAVVAGRAIDQRVSLAKADTDAAFDETIDRIVATKKKVDAVIAEHPDDEQLARLLRQIIQQKADNLIKMDNATAERRYVMAAEDIREKIPPPPPVRPEPQPIIIEQTPYRAPHESPYLNSVYRKEPFNLGAVFAVVLVATCWGIIIGAVIMNR